MSSPVNPVSPIEPSIVLSASPPSGGLTSPATLRSAPYTLQTSLYEGLFDGSYRTVTSPLASCSPASPRSWEPELSCSKIVQEFTQNRLFDESRLKKLRIKAVRRYNRTLLRQKKTLLRSLNSLNCLVSFDGECVIVELQICEVDLAQVALAHDLRDKYHCLLKLVENFQNPYNLDSEKRSAEIIMMDALYEFNDVLQMLQYLNSQKNVLIEALGEQRGNICVREWFRKIFQG